MTSNEAGTGLPAGHFDGFVHTDFTRETAEGRLDPSANSAEVNDAPPCHFTPIGLREIAELGGFKREYVDTLRHRGRLPEPRWIVSGSPVWLKTDIEEWIAGRKGPA
jgi:predicted DNA-binding transcriptional regulator AlpA